MNSNRLLGILLIVFGVIIGAVAVTYLFSNEGLTGPARILGLALALIVLVGPLVGGGIYLTAFGGREAAQQQAASQQRKLLNIVQTRGQVRVDDIAVELQVPRAEVRDIIYALVGLGVFSGYIKWDEGILYSSEASKLRDLKQCPNCGGAIELTGKGMATCRFCGTEFYLS